MGCRVKRAAMLLAVGGIAAVGLPGAVMGTPVLADPVSPATPQLGGALPSDPALALSALDRRIGDLDGERRGDEAELSRVGEDIARLHTRVLEDGRAYYRLTRAGLLPIGGGFGALVTYAMHVERARRLAIGDLRAERNSLRRAGDLRSEIERLERDRAALAAQRQSVDSARTALEDERRRQTAFDRAFETSSGAGDDYVAVYGAGAAPEMTAGGFASARGRLLFPVVARGADVRPARRQGTSGPGLEIHAPAGSVVRAVFAARVAFADRYGPYGRIVILDHGDHYYTISGNLDAVDVKIGQDVGAGDRLGTVGDDGAGAMLYFEVRHGSQAISPGPWLGL